MTGQTLQAAWRRLQAAFFADGSERTRKGRAGSCATGRLEALFLMEGGEFKEIEVSTLGELLDQSTPAPDPASGRRRNYSVYRGARDGPFGLLTSLDKLGGCNPPQRQGV